MSYCRWSSENYWCDLYCYEDVSGGFTTHVASNRAVGEIPKTPPLTQDTIDEHVKAWTIQHEFLATCLRNPIGLRHDGESFNDPDLESFLARLIDLKNIGYNVPDRVIKNVQDEIKDEAPKVSGVAG